MALPNATWSGQTIVTAVSRLCGLANDSTTRAAVLDYVNMGLWEISLQTPWDWNATTATDVTATAGNNAIPLPTASGSAFDEVYDVRLVGTPERTLLPLDLRTYDRTRAGVQTGTSTPTHYYIYGSQTNAALTLVPTPNVSNVVRIRYLIQQATISDATASSLAVKDKYVPMVIYKGAELVSQWRSPERAQMWQARYERTLARALQVNRESPDENPSFVPRNQNGIYYDPLYPDDLHEYSR